MRSTRKSVFIISLLLFLAIAVAWNWSLLIYGINQGIGQLGVISKARPVTEVLSDPNTPDSIKNKLILISEARRYAIDSLGLNDTDNYSTLFDQQGKEILWVVTASEPYQLKEKRWEFPILGSVPYKGFFDLEKAKKEREVLDNEGWDTSISNPSGWSTLGWFTDPILSDMLEKNEGDLASLIIHEMVHSTIYVKDSSSFNENLASFIGDLAALKFVDFKYGKHSKEHDTYLQEDYDFRTYSAHVLRGATLLDSVYEAVKDQPIERKKEAKEKAMGKIVSSMDTLKLFGNRKPSKRFEKKLPNNTFFLSFRRYQSKQMDLNKMFEHQFNSDFKKMVDYFKERYPFL
jgi:predicted aminopeptidase